MKNLIQKLFSLVGFEIIKIKLKDTCKTGNPNLPNGNSNSNNNKSPYEIVTPYATYAPWLLDFEFLAIFHEIENHTLVDIYRCYELWQITGIIRNIDKTSSFIEIGVWRGGTAAIVSKKLNILNSKANFFLADTFKGVVKATDKDLNYSGGEHADTSQDMVESLLFKKYYNYQILPGIFPNETAHLIPAGINFGYCHIDVDVYESAKDIVNWIWSKMIIGGIIIFDDYGFVTCSGITEYVNELRKMTDRIVIHNLNGHAIVIKIS